ncbi:uncharacterized protein [Rutidosis leptorrhynchoides]|uniref:uncharacterized protein n=1 Tax=Rutidosis leptorrhynchoides TaxID=125765 RepID=UPI003A9973AF
MPSPRNKKEVQSLTDKLAALTRFLSKFAERSLPFFETLKICLKKTDFKWTEEAEVAFQEMKRLLKELPTMTAPIAGETLILYLAASKEAISSVQMPLYFVSKALTGSELIYPAIEKPVYALVKEVKVKSVDTDGISAAVEKDEPSWMTPIVEFLNIGTLPINSTEARKIKMKAPMYLLDKGILYIKSFLGPHLWCLNPTQAESIIREVHEGKCALHSGHKIVASKIMQLGYYQLSMYRDAAEFGIPNEIVSDDGTKFEGNPFNDWCQELKIKQTFTSVAHPQANGQCEVTNRDIVLGIKARLGCTEGVG